MSSFDKFISKLGISKLSVYSLEVFAQVCINKYRECLPESFTVEQLLEKLDIVNPYEKVTNEDAEKFCVFCSKYENLFNIEQELKKCNSKLSVFTVYNYVVDYESYEEVLLTSEEITKAIDKATELYDTPLFYASEEETKFFDENMKRLMEEFDKYPEYGRNVIDFYLINYVTNIFEDLTKESFTDFKVDLIVGYVLAYLKNGHCYGCDNQ